MTTIGEIISRVRGSLKEHSTDTPYSNRYIWYTFYGVAKTLIKQDADDGRLYSMSDIWEPICVEMEPVSSIYCNCQFLPYNCMVYRSKQKLPKFLEASNGFIYRWISTLDLSRSFTLVTPYEYQVKSKMKFGRKFYAFIHDGYLYTPSNEFPTLSVSALFDGDLSKFNCDSLDTDEPTQVCNSVLSRKIQIPSYLEDFAIDKTLQKIFPSIQIPEDKHPNNNSNQKELTP